jgi:SNF2 family DNA or RNA helicase
VPDNAMDPAADHVFKTEPWAHQREAFLLSRDREYFALLMEMGTGKTHVAINTMAWLFGRGRIAGALLIVPKSIARVWRNNELPRHLHDSVRRHVVIYKSSPTRAHLDEVERLLDKDPLELKVLIVNVEGLHRKPCYDFCVKFLRAHRALTVVDESITIANPRAKRTDKVLRLGDESAYRRIMTGAPGLPMQVWSQLTFLSPSVLGTTSWYAHRNRYAQLRTRVVNDHKFEEITGYQYLDDLEAKISRHAYRKLKSECLDLPPKLFAQREVDMHPEQWAFYEQLRKDSMVELLLAEEKKLLTAPLVLTKLLRLRQVLAGFYQLDDEPGPRRFMPCLRTEVALDVAREATGKVLIWSNFRPSLELLFEKLAHEHSPAAVGIYYGDTHVDQRAEYERRFQDPADPLRFLVLNPATGGRGLTLTQASVSIQHDHGWSLEQRQQLEDRPHRGGLKHAVTYVDLRCPDTVDDAMLGAIANKAELASQVIGDWRRIIGAGRG